MQLIEKRPWIIVLLVCLVLYFQNSWVPGMFHDGYLYIAFGKNAAEKGHWLVPFLSETEYPKFDQHPPLYFILEGLWFKLFKFSWTSARIFGLLWMLAAAIAFFQLLRKKMGERIALCSSMVLLLMPSLLKKARFPNLDFPLLLFSILIFLSLFNIKKEKIEKTWLFIGFLGGIALLIKGAGALFIMGIVGLFLLLSKEDREQLKTPWPYVGLLFSFLIFGVWPLALKQAGEFRIFEGYISGQVLGSVVKGRHIKDVDYFLYFKHLLKTTLPFILLGLWKVKDIKKNHHRLFLLSTIWLLLPLFVFSLMKVKFSNYLIPLYPAIAIFAGYGLSKLPEVKFQKLKQGFSILMVTAAVVLLIFPLTNKQRRHKETFKILRTLKEKGLSPKEIVFVDESYEYYSTASLFSIFHQSSPRRATRENLKEVLNQTKPNPLLFIPKGFRLETWTPHSFTLIEEFKHKNLEVIYLK